MTVTSLARRHFPGLVIADSADGIITTPTGLQLQDFTSGFCPAGVSNTGYRQTQVNGAGAGLPLAAPADLLAALSSYMPATTDAIALYDNGADASVALIAAARRATGKQAALFIRDRRQPRVPAAVAAAADVALIPFPRPPAADPPGVTVDEALVELEKALAARPTAIVVVEAILGGGAAIVAPKTYLHGVAELTAAAGAWLAFDERGAGYGRSGPFFAYHGADVTPDALLLGGAMAGGKALAAVAGSAGTLPPENAANVAPHVVTTAVATVPEAAALQENVVARGAELHAALTEMKSRYPFFAAVNGRGLLQSVAIGVPGRGPDPYLTGLIQAQCLNEGLLLAAGDHDDSSLVWQPPLSISAAALAAALDTLQEAFEEVFDD